MQIHLKTPLQRERGYAFLLTIGFVSISILVLASIAKWGYSNTALTSRNNAYNSTVAAAEAATEVVIAQMGHDFLHQSLAKDAGNYARILPDKFVPAGWPAEYEFSDREGNKSQTEILCGGWRQKTTLNGEFAGLYGMVNSYTITANARKLTGLHPVAAGVRQSIDLTAIPLFQYAIFYSLDLEINPGAPMMITGKTHGNADLYLAPSSSLEFLDKVSYVGEVLYNRHTNDPTTGGKSTPVFDGPVQQVSALTLPVGTDNNPTNVVQILDPPAVGENPQSLLGKERFYNKADMVIEVTDSKVTVKFNDFEDGSKFTAIPTNRYSFGTNSGYSFVNTNVSFYDYREKKRVVGTEIDIQALTNWMATAGFSYNVQAQSQMGHQINSLYVNDKRLASGKLTAVRVANGQYLPSSGLTVSAPHPLYVKGNFNAPDLTVGSTNTSRTMPASLVGDAITILSPNWDDTWSASTPLSARSAANATVNAAFMAGIVQSASVSGQKHYSGGVENFPRFLENWRGTTLTYNGSMVVMFASRFATNFWIDPGTYYNPPTRSWAFNQNFLDPDKLPPDTPQVRKLHRGSWSVVAASSK